MCRMLPRQQVPPATVIVQLKLQMTSQQQAVSISSLQNELEALQGLCPVLLPSVVPHGYDDQDLWGLVDTEGPEQQEYFQQELKSLVKQRKQQSAEGAAHQCCICVSEGKITASGSSLQGEGTTLRFTTLPTVSFTTRTIHLTNAGFACGNCRALRQAGRFLAFVGTSGLYSNLPKQYEKRQHMLASLSLHLAATNQQPEELQANPDALKMWTQEVMSRAYALHVLASAVPGWKVVGPTGQAVSQATPGLGVQLLQGLLAPEQLKKRKGNKAVSTRQPEPMQTNTQNVVDKAKTPKKGHTGEDAERSKQTALQAAGGDVNGSAKQQQALSKKKEKQKRDQLPQESQPDMEDAPRKKQKQSPAGTKGIKSEVQHIVETSKMTTAQQAAGSHNQKLKSMKRKA